MRLRDGTSVEDPRLDRLVEFDEASRQFPARALLPRTAAEPVTKAWRLPAAAPVLDQQRDGACVGFGVANELRFYPVAIRGVDETFARERIYWPAQRLDKWPGGSYPDATPQMEGTSVLAGLKAATAEGYIGAYRWAFGETDLALAVGHLGPAIIGVSWWTGMFYPDEAGYLQRTGTREGGHCVLVTGINCRSNFYTIYNSWGFYWGHHGKARINRADMAELLADAGEAAIVTARLRPAATTP